VYELKRAFRYQVYRESHPAYARFMQVLDGRFGRFMSEHVTVARYPFNWAMKQLSRRTEPGTESAVAPVPAGEDVTAPRAL
jgi:hypothetical protein